MRNAGYFNLTKMRGGLSLGLRSDCPAGQCLALPGPALSANNPGYECRGEPLQILKTCPFFWTLWNKMFVHGMSARRAVYATAMPCWTLPYRPDNM